MSTGKTANKGNLIYHDKVEKYTNDGKIKSAEESVVNHAEDGYSAKYFVKKGDKSTKIEVKSSSTGGEYTLIVQVDGGDRKTSMHNKAEIVAYLKKDKALSFMLDYIERTKSLSRSKAKKSRSKKVKKVAEPLKTAKKSKSKSKKARRKVKSMSRTKKSKSRKAVATANTAKKSKSKSKKVRKKVKSMSRAKKAKSRSKGKKSGVNVAPKKMSSKSKSKSKSKPKSKSKSKSKSRGKKRTASKRK
jgi:hypothetical protein